MDSVQDLTTAQSYIEHYYEQLKKELNARGLQISKVGIIGLMLHILGFSQQDAKQYYDTLFREAFVGTADKYENLIMHGSVFGYFPMLATPASAVGDFELNFKALPTASGNASRTILIENLEIDISGIKFKLDSSYIIQGSTCQITDSNGKVTHVPFSQSNPKISIIDLVQYEEESKQFTVPFYVFGSYYPKIIELSDTSEDSSITEVEVFVQEEEDGEFIKYETRVVDYFTGSDEEVVFIKYLPNQKIFIELGSGIHGKYIPNSTIKVNVKSTLGTAGNVSKQSVSPTGGRARVYETSKTDGSASGSYTLPLTSLVTVNVNYADGGTNALEGQDLREAIISYIRSRDNLMSELDFYDGLSEYLTDFILMFKKTHVVDNVAYCFAPFRDQYKTPVKSMSLSVPHSEFNPERKCHIYRPTFVLDGVTYISPFLYSIDYMMRFYRGYSMWEQVSSYFSDVNNEMADAVTGEIPVEYAKTLPLTLYAQYNSQNDNTKFTIQSYESMDGWVFYFSIPALGIYDVCMSPVSETLADYFYYNTTDGTGLLFDTVDISIKAFYGGTHLLTYNLYDFSMINDISDMLTLKTYEGQYVDLGGDLTIENGTLNIDILFSDDSVVLNIPVMRLDTFEEDEDYYIQVMENQFVMLSDDKNRMLSDDVQIRYTNTDYLQAATFKSITKQSHDHDLNLPLQLHIDIVAYKDKVNSAGINTVEAEYTLKERLAAKLFSDYTGHDVSFYRTQIVDIVHELSWVKHCNVRVWDAKSREIADANLELYDQKTVVNRLDKAGAIAYCPLYIWWNLDNITIDMSFE